MNIITSNEGKFKEYKKIFPEARMHNVGYHEIQADTLEEVVEHALMTLKEHAPLMIDDSGLFIDEYDGFPGVYSAYVMQTLGCKGILRLMNHVENRNSRFECVIGYMDSTGNIELFKGITDGTIICDMRGTEGFGYDPIFIPVNYEKTFAQMTTEEKNKISHRGKAMKALLRYREITG